MGLKFTIGAALFQIVLIILFSVLVDYSNHALPPHKRKGATADADNSSESLPVNDVAIYYPSKTMRFFLFSCINITDYGMRKLRLSILRLSLLHRII